MTTNHAVQRRIRGFTLVEMMLAAALGALLMIATAQSAGLFATTVAALESDSADDIDRALARIARDVRYAWWADVPSATRLRLADASGDVSEYRLDGTDLLLELPSGETGVLAADVTDVTFEVINSITRYRDGPTQSVYGTLAQCDVPSPDKTYAMGHTGMLGLGLTLAEDAGEGSVTGVNERLVYAVPESLELPIASSAGFSGQVVLTLSPSKAHGDARLKPGAAALGSKPLGLAILPLSTIDLTRVTMSLLGGLWKTAVCHAGVDTNIPVGDLAEHIAHGDIPTCGSEESFDVFSVPTINSNLAFTMPNVQLYPGVGYTLQFTVNGLGSISLVAAKSRSKAWDIVKRKEAGDDVDRLDREFPFVLRGTRVITTTTETAVVASVGLSITSAAGETRSGSSSVYNQVMAPDPWTGVVPGETGATP